MSFLYPSFLFALGAIAIPIIIHLFNFRRYKTIYFSNLKFLREVKEKTDARSNLKHLLVLLCRILAITFLVLAFAQPYIKSKNTNTVAGRKAISIFIDNSFSMGQLSADVPLLEQAKVKAKEIVNSYGADDVFQILTEDFEGKHQRLVDQQEAINLITEIQISPATQTIADAIARQEQALAQSNASQKLLYLVSDFQKNFSDLTSIIPDSTLQINLVPLRAREAANVYIDTCWLQSPVQVAGQPAKLFVRIVNDEDESIDNGRLTLTINDAVKAISNFSAGANGKAVDTIAYNVTEKGWNRATVSIVDHPITFDDEYFFTYLVEEHCPVMVISESSGNPYLDALFSSDPFFTLTNVSASQLNYAQLPDQQFVILNGLKDISSGLASELKKFLEQGGNVLVFPDVTANTGSYNAFLQSVNADQFGNFQDQKKTVNAINTQDAVFSDVFQRVPQNMALPRSSGNFSLSTVTRAAAIPLLRFSDGTSLIVKYRAGDGLLYVSTVPLDKNISDLPVNPVFAPMMYKMAVMRETAAQAAYVIGKNNQATVRINPGASDQVLHLKGASQEFIPAQRLVGNEVTIDLGHQVEEAGIYSVQNAPGDAIAYFAFNYDRKESDLKFLTDKELEESAPRSKINVISNADRNLGGVIAGQKLGVPLWKVSVIFALLFIALEMLLLKLWK